MPGPHQQGKSSHNAPAPPLGGSITEDYFPADRNNES